MIDYKTLRNALAKVGFKKAEGKPFVSKLGYTETFRNRYGTRIDLNYMLGDLVSLSIFSHGVLSHHLVKRDMTLKFEESGMTNTLEIVKRKLPVVSLSYIPKKGEVV